MSFCPKPGIGLPLKMAYECTSRNCFSKPGPYNLLPPMCLATETKPRIYWVRKNSAAFKSLSVEKIKVLTNMHTEATYMMLSCYYHFKAPHSFFIYSVVEDKSTLGENGASACIGGSSVNMFHIIMCVLLKVSCISAQRI